MNSLRRSSRHPPKIYAHGWRERCCLSCADEGAAERPATAYLSTQSGQRVGGQCCTLGAVGWQIPSLTGLDSRFCKPGVVGPPTSTSACPQASTTSSRTPYTPLRRPHPAAGTTCNNPLPPELAPTRPASYAHPYGVSSPRWPGSASSCGYACVECPQGQMRAAPTFAISSPSIPPLTVRAALRPPRPAPSASHRQVLLRSALFL